MSMTREKAIAVIWNRCQHCKETEEAIKALNEERPHGEWKYESYGQYLSSYKCSICGFHGDKQWISCPYCDAKMKEGDEK